MPLTQEQEDREHELRCNQMIINIDKMRRDNRNETIKIVISLAVAFAICIGAGVTLATYVGLHRDQPATASAKP